MLAGETTERKNNVSFCIILTLCGGDLIFATRKLWLVKQDEKKRKKEARQDKIRGKEDRKNGDEQERFG